MMHGFTNIKKVMS